MTIHSHHERRPLFWRVCKLIYGGGPRISSILPGLTRLPEPLAQAICAALEEAKPGRYFIESEPRDDE